MSMSYRSKTVILGMLIGIALMLAACTVPGGTPTQALDPQAQVATIVAATGVASTQAALSATPVAPPAIATVEVTLASAPQTVAFQIAPELQSQILQQESLLKIYALNEAGEIVQQQEITGPSSVTQFEMALAPGIYRFAAVYSPLEGVDLLGLWAADGSAQLVEVGAGQPVSPVILSRPAAPCQASTQQVAEQLGIGDGHAQISGCATGTLLVSFDPSVQSPPPAAIYAISEGMVPYVAVQDVAAAAPGTTFTLSVLPGVYTVYARSMLASDVSFYGAWGQSGLALVQVAHKGSANVSLVKPGDPCLANYQLGASPDMRFPETQAYSVQLHCGETAGSSSGGESMGLTEMGRNPDGVETFKDGSAWYQYEDDKYSFSVTDGEMVMVGKKPELNDAWVTAPIKLKDFYMEAVFKVGDTCSDKDRYGLLVRAPKPEYGYVISFTCGGKFRLYYMDNDKYIAVQEWKSSDLIVKGTNATNRMGVWMKGNQIKLYANGKLLGTYTDSAFEEGITGVHIGPAQTGMFEVRVDEIQWWDLSK